MSLLGFAFVILFVIAVVYSAHYIWFVLRPALEFLFLLGATMFAIALFYL